MIGAFVKQSVLLSLLLALVAGQTTEPLPACNVCTNIQATWSRVDQQDTRINALAALAGGTAGDLLATDRRVDELRTDLLSNKVRVGWLEETVDVLKNDLTQAQARIAELTTNQPINDTRIQELETLVAKNAARISELGANLEDRDVRIATLDARLNNNTERMIEQADDIAELKQRPAAEPVGFSAKGPMPLLHDDTMTFSDVITNVGQAYESGLFTAPRDGLYYFSVSLLKAHSYDDAAFCSLLQNNMPLVKAYTHPEPSPRAGNYPAVTSVYVQLYRGDKMALGTCSPISSSFSELSTFSGFLVTPMDVPSLDDPGLF